MKQIGHASEQIPNLESIEIKIEFKTEVTEEACEEYNANEQIGVDFITSEGVDTSIQNPVKTVSEQIPSVELGQMETVVKVETFEDFEAHEQLGTEFKTEVKTEEKKENLKDFEIQGPSWQNWFLN